MREILFRGKTTKKENENYGFNNAFVYGDLLTNKGVYYIHPQNNVFRVHNELANILVAHEVIPETVGQFTGLTDKNGKKIFEGDIVRVKGKETEENWKDYDEFGKVVFENGAFLIKVANIFNGKKYFSEVHSRYMTTADWVEREVVGNVFENKELLGENK